MSAKPVLVSPVTTAPLIVPPVIVAVDVNAPLIVAPAIVGVEKEPVVTVGLVKVLFVNVCELVVPTTAPVTP